jgi:mono/diheme cytochrome c family protein
VKFRTAILTAAAFGLAAACTPAANEPAPATPDPAPIAADEAPAPSGPAAENTTDSLSTAPAADPAAPAAATPAATTPAAPAVDEIANGRAVYNGAGACAMCHGPTGQGTPMGVALTAGLDYAAIKEKVVKGMINSGDKMPPMGAALSAEQLDDLAKFVEAGLPQ